MPTRLKECEILLRVTSEALNNVESELLSAEQRNLEEVFLSMTQAEAADA